jgi:hypothetical protein
MHTSFFHECVTILLYFLETKVRGIAHRADGKRGWTFTTKDVKTGAETKEVRNLTFVMPCMHVGLGGL